MSLLYAQAFKAPVLSGRVNDYADILSATTEERLAEKLRQLEITDSTQIAVLTVPSLQGLTVEEYAIETAEAWQLGTRENDNGGILLVAPTERKIRIETGYGLEGTLTDVRAGRIIDTVIAPEFRLNRYDEGVLKGVDAIIATVRGEYTGTGSISETRSTEDDEPGSFLPFLVLVFILVMAGSRKRIFGGISGAVLLPLFAWFFFPGALPFLIFLVPGGFILGLLFSLFRFLPGSSGRYRRHGGFWSGYHRGGFGGFRGRSGGGGWGGFSGGGGGFGGGGASGSW